MSAQAQFVSEATRAYRARLNDLVDAFGVPTTDARTAGEQAATLTAAGMAWNDAIGPFLDTDGVRAVLGGPTRQAVGDRVRNRRLLALRTADTGGGTRLVYPLWQFDGAILTTLPRVPIATGYDPGELTHGWHVAAWLSAPDPGLGGLRARDLLATGNVEPVLALTGDVRYELGVDEVLVRPLPRAKDLPVSRARREPNRIRGVPAACAPGRWRWARGGITGYCFTTVLLAGYSCR